MALTDNLMAFYDLSEASGATRVDSVSANNLSDNNTVGQSAAGGPGGQNVATFAPASSQYLSRADVAALSLGGDNPFTFQIWAYIDSKATFRGMFGQYATLGDRSYAVYYDSSADRITARLVYDGNNNLDVVANNLGSPSVNTWYHILVSHATGGTWRIRVNNGTADTTSIGAVGTFNSSTDVTVGDAFAGSGLYMSGRLALFGKWNRVLTSGEEDELWDGGAGLSYAEMVGGAVKVPVMMHNYRRRRAS